MFELKVFCGHLIFSSWSSTRSCSSATGSSRLKIWKSRSSSPKRSLCPKLLFENKLFNKTIFFFRKNLWEWSGILLNVSTLKKKAEDGLGKQRCVWAHHHYESHPQHPMCEAVCLKRFTLFSFPFFLSTMLINFTCTKDARNANNALIIYLFFAFVSTISYCLKRMNCSSLSK